MHPSLTREQSAWLLGRAQAEIPTTALLVFDLDMRFVAAAGGALASFGLDAERLIGAAPADLGGAWSELVPCCAEALADLRTSASTLDWSPGPHTTYSCAIGPLRDEAGAVVGGLIAIRAINAEMDAREIIERSSDLLCRHEPGGAYAYVSPACRRIYGLEPSAMVGHHPLDFVHPDDVAAVAAAIEHARGADSFEVEHRIVRADGSVAFVQALMTIDPGTGVSWGSVRDITDEREREARLRELSAVLEGAFEGAPGGIALQHCDGTFFKVNERLCRMLGYSQRELIGKTYRDITHPDDRDRDERGVADLLAGRIAVHDWQKRYVRANGESIWVELSASLVRDEHGHPLYLVAQTRDITAARRQEQELAEITARFEGAFAHAPIGMSLVGLDGSWLQVNQALCAIIGRTEPELVGMSFQDVTHPDDVSIGLEGFGDLLAGQTDVWETEKRYVHADGHIVWVAVSASTVRDGDGDPQYIVAQTRDISEHKRLARELEHLADHDTLTELYNRRRFESELGQQLARNRRHGDTAALVMLDLDHFKYVNDSLGHTVGDRVIAHVGRVLTARLRETDIIARLGGDEFAVILDRIELADAQQVVCELVKLIESHPFVHSGHTYLLSASVGLVMLDAATASAEDAMVEVDIAVYEAKQTGRNRACVYCPETRTNVLEGLTWSQRLREALAGDGFELHAQPIVNLQTGQTEIFELLIRMRSDAGELIAPHQFLEPAARFGYMPDVDRWVIARSARMAAACPGRKLAVNLAGKTLSEPGLVRYITDALRDAGADPADVMFEVSEADVIANVDAAREACEELRALGCTIALDDFGSGFSGFSYLKAFPIDLLKIDGQFVRELASNEVDRLVVRAILDVAQGMGLPTVAEFVTDEAVAEQCRALGATYGQGFHLGKPQPLPATARSVRGSDG